MNYTPQDAIYQRYADVINLLEIGINTILPKSLFSLINEEGFVAGKFFSDVTNSKHCELEVFFKNEQGAKKAKKTCSSVKTCTVLAKNNVTIEKRDDGVVLHSSNFFPYFGTTRVKLNFQDIDEPDKLVKSSSFTVLQNYYDFKNKELYIKNFDDIVFTTIRYNKNDGSPILAIQILVTLLTEGYCVIDETCFVEIAKNLKKIDFNNEDVLNQQMSKLDIRTSIAKLMPATERLYD